MKVDLYNHENKYTTWEETIGDKIPGIGKEKSDIILAYPNDMKRDANIALEALKVQEVIPD